MKFDNPSDSYTSFKSLVESLLKRSNSRTSIKDNKTFDMFFYNNKYTDIYAPYLLDLKKNLPKEYIEMFILKVIEETCIFENELDGTEELVGLVCSIH